MFACIHVTGGEASKVFECAQSFSPLVERTSPETAVMEAAGLDRLFGWPQEIAAAIARRAAALGLEVNVALAPNPDAAIFAARGFTGISVVPEGDEAKFLETLPLTLLNPLPEILETLEAWGIRTFRDLAALPETGIAERLGPEGVRLRRLARGEARRPLAPAGEPLEFREEEELDYPVELLEPLSFVMARMLTDVCARLDRRGLATCELRLRLGLENAPDHERSFRLPVPMREPRAFLKLMQLELSAHPPGAAVVKVALEAGPVKPRVAQHGLYVPEAPEPEKLELTLARIEALVGEGNVGTPELLDTHRPDAFQMVRWRPAAGAPPPAARTICAALRRFRPPRAAQVHELSGRPALVSAGPIRGKVADCAGPWRTAGDWWTGDPWARDEWDVALQDGAVYRIFCDLHTGRWFVEGCYD